MNLSKIEEIGVSTIPHIMPYGGKEPMHLADAECWCSPLVEENKVIHNAKDCREAYERKYNKQRTRQEFWVTVHVKA